MLGLVGKLFGDSNEREVRKLRPLVEEINALEPQFEKLDNAALRAKTEEFRGRLAKGESLDDILPEAFAAVREAAKRTLGQRHFDMQLMGGMVLHQGKIAEMKTGEGKTLVATLPVYLNALAGQGVHVVTVNDYLAKRDTQWMGPIYHLLGLSIGCLQHDASYLFDPTASLDDASMRRLAPADRRAVYEADITYGTNNEFGFDYLRDNMVLEMSQRVQRVLHYAIVDEVDNILIDEARTPLIISGASRESAQLYQTFARVIPRLQASTDYEVDEKRRAVTFTEAGIARLEKALNVANLYDPENSLLTHYAENALRAHVLYKRDRDYVVRDGEVVIVDEFTGRLMFGRRYSEGLHQAIEAKEGVKVQQESITMATVTLQNYFRMYGKLAGMTGTAATEAEEFWKTYKLDVVVIPTNRPLVRTEFQDQIYKTEKAKFKAVADEIEDLYKQGRPVLVGTVSIEKSEELSELLQRRGVPHQVLNAKHHEKEAAIVAQAGRPGAVTVATNMAGRGTDIILGGNPDGLLEEELRRRANGSEAPSAEKSEAVRQEVMARWQADHDRVVSLGGLHVLGTEHHDARRIDNQLRGRSGRQGDPGSSRFYASLEDDLMRRFGGDRVKTIMNWAGLGDDVPLEHGLVTRALAGAQVKVEAYHFEMRKHLLEYDDVVNKHREVIYGERLKVLSGADLKVNILAMIDEELEQVVTQALRVRSEDGSEWEGLLAAVSAIMPLGPGMGVEELSQMGKEEVVESLKEQARRLYERKEQEYGPENMRQLERIVMLRTIDAHWIEHLTMMENLRQGVGLEAVGQRDPLVMYKTQGHQQFQEMLGRIRQVIVRNMLRAELVRAPAPRLAAAGSRELVGVGARKVGRNDPCPCGSGKKYKKCHGAAV